MPRFYTLFVALIAMAPLSALAEGAMTQKEMSAQIIGKQLRATRLGVNVSLRYLADGTVTLNVLLASYAGTWDFEGNSICMDMSGGPRKGGNCVTFAALGGNKFLNSEGVTMTA